MKRRIKINDNSLYGIWHDVSDTIDLKFTPPDFDHFSRIKIISHRSLAVIETISKFCGLKTTPERTNWEGFNLITGLTRSDSDTLINGSVHLPRKKQRNWVNMKIVTKKLMCLDFYCAEGEDKSDEKGYQGSIFLVKELGGDDSVADHE